MIAPVILFGLTLLFSASVLPQQKAFAQNCGYDQNKQPIPCPPGQKEKKRTKTPIHPSKTPIPTATNTKVESAQKSVPAIGNNSSNPQCSNNLNNGSASGSGQASSGGNTFFSWLMGGSGLLLGSLIGLLIPRRGRFDSSAPIHPASIIGPETRGELLPAVDMFHKDRDTSTDNDRIEPVVVEMYTEEIHNKFSKDQDGGEGNTLNTRDNAGTVDMFHKGRDADNNGDHNISQVHVKGYDDRHAKQIKSDEDDSANDDLSSSDMENLQHNMDQHSKLEDLISNEIKKADDSRDSLTGSGKAS